MVDRQGRMSRQGNGRQEGKDGRKRNGRQEGKDGQAGERGMGGQLSACPYEAASLPRSREWGASIDESIALPMILGSKVLESDSKILLIKRLRR